MIKKTLGNIFNLWYNILVKRLREPKPIYKKTKRQVKEMEEAEEMSLSDKAIQRLREYLLEKGWTAEEILDLLDYITK